MSPRLLAFSPLVVVLAIVTIASGAASAATSACPTSNHPNEIVLSAGSGQTAQLGKQFPQAFEVALANTNACPLTGNLAGININFDAPGSGASGIFAGSGSREATVGTNAQGVATAPPFTANYTAGSYTVDAHSDYGTVEIYLSNTVNGLAAAITPTSGSPQEASINAQYAQPLQARVTDAAGNPVQGATVNFSFVTGPSGADALFLGSQEASATTDSNGTATSPPFIANASPGRFTAIASTDGLSAVATYTLDNHAASQTLSAETSRAQSATIDSRYAKPLTARLVDAGGQPIEGASVTFTLGAQAGASGAAGAAAPDASFVAGTNQATVLTDANGIATSPLFTADGTPGDFTATASSPATTAVSFALRNLPAHIAATSKSTSTATVGTRYHQRPTAKVRNAHGKGIDGVSVTFTISSSSGGATATFPDGSKVATVLTGAGGEAAAPRPLANTTTGSFTIAAAISGTTSIANLTLRNRAGRPTTVVAGAASGESAVISQRFPAALAVTVSDQYGNPVAGATVTFTAPASGASGSFSEPRRRHSKTRNVSTHSTRRVAVKTNASGIAIAPPFTANATAGGYIVTATAKGSTAHASFALVNTRR